MDITPHGFAGSLDEEHWAQLAGLLGVSSAVGSSADFKVTPVSGVRRVAIAPGLAYAPGVLAEAEEAGTLNLPEPAAGQWFLIVLRRNWTTRSIAVTYVPGAVTSNTVPTTTPAAFPTVNGTVGQLHDQKLAWAWVHNLTQNVTVFDLRMLRHDSRPDPDPSWGALTDKPTTFPPSSHSYSSHSGVVPISDGGTGSTTAEGARNALGLDASSVGASPSGHTHSKLVGNTRSILIESSGKCYIYDPSGPDYYWVVEPSGTLSKGIIPWDRITGAPSTWAPSSHSHPHTDIKVNGVVINEWARANFAELTHTHTAAAISDSGGKGRQILRAEAADEVREMIGAAATSHTHNGTYFTEAEVTAKLAGKANSSHSHAASSIATSGSNVQKDLDYLSDRIDGKQSTTGTFGGAGVNTPGNVVAAGDIGCNGRMQSKGSRNSQVSSNYVSAYLDANGYFGYAPSVRAMKQNITPWVIDRDAFMAIKPVTFRYRSSVNKLGADAPIETGFIADDFVDAGLAQFTFNDPDTGLVSGLAYERLTTALWSVVQQQQIQIDGLVTDVAALKATAGAGA